MGKGDMKTRRGKIIAGSYGVRRKRNKKRNRGKSLQVATAAEAPLVKETISKVKSTVEETVESISPPKVETEQKPAKKKAALKVKAPKETT